MSSVAALVTSFTVKDIVVLLCSIGSVFISIDTRRKQNRISIAQKKTETIKALDDHALQWRKVQLDIAAIRNKISAIPDENPVKVNMTDWLSASNRLFEESILHIEKVRGEVLKEGRREKPESFEPTLRELHRVRVNMDELTKRYDKKMEELNSLLTQIQRPAS